ncbi:hypothetical protein [Luteimonas sp. FCS-9]|uniref:hypothetical protein n=1 Tax=Luteimonas sp. FCS-9 TaxID=1547516 RepID=UPI00063EB49D|nr:hypothetical protein [Luteimonas sp. FCS-9]KLJ01308.1 hypothetical protein WQ56_05885 [Luteimonas sp. FCS-9]
MGRHLPSFGISLDQVDRFDSLIRLIVAQGDVLSSVDPRQLEADSVPALGDAIYEAGVALRTLMEQVGEQALQDADATAGTKPG